MKNIKLTTVHGQREVIVNWNNVDFVKDTLNNFGDKYTEVHCGNQTIDVKESLKEIDVQLNSNVYIPPNKNKLK